MKVFITSRDFLKNERKIRKLSEKLLVRNVPVTFFIYIFSNWYKKQNIMLNPTYSTKLKTILFSKKSLERLGKFLILSLETS